MKFLPSIISALITITGCIIYFSARKKVSEIVSDFLLTCLRVIGIVISIIGLWLFAGCIITLIAGTPANEELSISIIPPRADFSIYGYRPSVTMLVSWGVMASLIVGAIIMRIFFIPKLTDVPGKFQNIVETLVESVENYTSAQDVRLGQFMVGYIFSIGATLIGNVVAELMGFRSPLSDLMFTFALSISVFIMANLYGIRKLSVRGRLKNLASPSPTLLPMRLISDIVTPFSMACRLFGNMLSGMIVMSLIYSALGNFAMGLPSIIGLYFNVFAAVIQTVIFITLALSSIHEATTEPVS